jgi:ferredoxin
MLFDKPTFDKLPKAIDDEEDTLELAVGLTPTSRLGCQVIVTKEIEGAVIRLPKTVVNQML